MAKPGDVLVAQTSDGRYTAVRILRKVGKSLLVSTSAYLGREPPSLDEPLLRKTLIQKRFFFDGEPARVWLDGPPSKNFELLGNLAPTKDEAKRECNSYGGKWCDTTGNEAFLEWRWLHDRAAFEEEVRREDELADIRRRLPQKPKRMMNLDEFWLILDLLDWKRKGNDDKVLAPAIKALASRSRAQICQFAERLAFLLYQLDTKAHASNIGEDSYDPDSEYVSADVFLYARCVVLVNGRAYYETVLKDPTKMPKDMEFEALLPIARQAYELKTGGELDYLTGCSYETFSNRDGWK